jgi:hypothetical protein
MRTLPGRIALSIGAGLLLLAAPGCGNKLHSVLKPATAPVASLRVVRLPTASPDSAAFEASWSANTTGRRIDHYLVALDPRSLDTSDPAWQPTRETHRGLAFASRAQRSSATPATDVVSDRHVFALRAVDAGGEVSEAVWRELAATNIPPSVQIVSPAPFAVLYQLIPPSVLITWTGNDPDGQFSQRPVKYKFKMFKDTDAIFGQPGTGYEQFDLARSNPDSLRGFYAPGFAGWDSTMADSTFKTYSNLVPESRYLFVVVGFDEAGDYNPVFSLNTNMLQLRVTFVGAVGPVISMFNEYFNYTYASGGYLIDPSRYVDVQVPAKVPLSFHWSANPVPGSLIHSYRWVLDPADLSDQTPRIDEATDWSHWSQHSLATSATVGPFDGLGRGRATHMLYIEAQDSNGLVSLGIVRFMVIPAPFSDETSLLIVNDTRLLPDHLLIPPDPAHPDSLAVPAGQWPMAAELDTFLFARGGVRHRMTLNGTLSQPGIFVGYQYDTVATQFLAGGLVPLALLSRYRHVLWITDQNSARGSISFLGSGALRRMCDLGRSDLLAAYVKQGGQLWIVGGAAGTASTIAWNDPTNDQWPPFNVLKFSSTAASSHGPELGLGRFMYDIAHWQSGFFATQGTSSLLRSPAAKGGWPGAPDYAMLPAQLGPKTLANDPRPPFRTSQNFLNAAQFHSLEYISEPTAIVQDLDPDPGVDQPASVMDTLFVATGVPAPQPAPSPYVPACMTYYHGSDNGAVLFSGFDLWTFTRPDLIKLTDFVLQQVWGLQRAPAPQASADLPLERRPGTR